MATRSAYRIEDLIGSPTQSLYKLAPQTMMPGGVQLAPQTEVVSSAALDSRMLPYLLNAVQMLNGSQSALVNQSVRTSSSSSSSATSLQAQLNVQQLTQMLANAPPPVCRDETSIPFGHLSQNGLCSESFICPGRSPTIAASAAASSAASHESVALLQQYAAHAQQSLSPAALASTNAAGSASVGQFTPIPWFIYQQMALRNAYQNGVSPASLSVQHAGSYLLASHSRKPKRIRTAFSPSQLLRLEAAFDKNAYVVGQERKELAAALNLRETQVKVWFQNRRTKKKRMKPDEAEWQCEDGAASDNAPSAAHSPSSASLSSKDSATGESPCNSLAKPCCN